MVYVGNAPSSGIGGNGNQASGGYFNEYLASRAAGGWTAGDIEPPPASEFESSPEYQSFFERSFGGVYDVAERSGVGGCTNV